MGDLMHAEQDATIDTFRLNNFKFREILLNEINEVYEFKGNYSLHYKKQ